MNNEPEIQRWTAKRKAELVKEIIKGKTNIAEATYTQDLTLAEVECWVDGAMQRMENAFKANPKDITVQRIMKLKHWQCRQCQIGFRPRGWL